MFAQRFDALARSVKLKSENKVVLKKLVTCLHNTDEYETYMGLYLMPTNTTMHLEIEDDMKTYTFFTIPAENEKIEEQK